VDAPPAAAAAAGKRAPPAGEEEPFPEEPFRGEFLEALRGMEMARLLRRRPELVDLLLGNMLELLRPFEEALSEQELTEQAGEEEDNSLSVLAGEPGAPAEEDDEEGSAEEVGAAEDENAPEEASNAPEDAALEAAREAAEQLVQEFEEQWAPAVDALDAMDELLGEPEGFDAEDFDVREGVWRNKGWAEVADLTRRLGNLRGLRDLIRSLGRGSGRGPMREAPAEEEVAGNPPGLVRSELVPEETSGVTLGGDVSRMLPAEALGLASRRPALKRLWHSRWAERRLVSYERVGWLEEDSRVLDELEYRPAGELGPIILCLDTSGSMAGPRETVAKATALECLRAAHLQGRPCYLYAFSGPEEVQELELGTDPGAMSRLLDFLASSFDGGTDVDKPLELSLQRLEENTWARADVLMVTDGEIPGAGRSIREALEDAQERLGLRVHALVVGDHKTPAIEELCSDIHLFDEWEAAEGRLTI
jgi:uncharacterized protein with von Willebrand factor type A (vWA) domain